MHVTLLAILDRIVSPKRAHPDVEALAGVGPWPHDDVIEEILKTEALTSGPTRW